MTHTSFEEKEQYIVRTGEVAIPFGERPRLIGDIRSRARMTYMGREVDPSDRKKPSHVFARRCTAPGRYSVLVVPDEAVLSREGRNVDVNNGYDTFHEYTLQNQPNVDGRCWPKAEFDRLQLSELE